MFHDLGDQLFDDVTVAAGEVESSLTWLLSTAGGKDNKISAGEVLKRGGGGNRCVRVKRHPMFEIGFFTLGFVPLTRKEDELGTETLE